MRNHPPALLHAALAAALLVSPACDRDGHESPDPTKATERADEPDDPTPPDFDWRAALDSDEKARRDALGTPADCDPDASTVESVDDVTPPAIADAMCRYPTDPSKGDAYTVDGLLFSEGTPIAIRLAPADDVPLAPSLVEEWNLPELPARRRLRLTDGDTFRRLLAYRADHIASETAPGTPFGIDLVAKPDAPETLDYALVYATAADPAAVADELALEGPPAADEETILPAAPVGQSPLAENVLRLGVRTIELAPWRHDTVPKTGESSVDPSPVTFSRDQFTDTAPPDAGGWESAVDEFVGALVDSRRKGERSSTFAVAATGTAPVGEVDELMGTMASMTETKFQFLTRAVDAFDADFTPYAATTALNVAFRPLAEGLPDGADIQRPGAGDELPRRDDGAFLNLHVKTGLDGFEVRAGGEPIPPRADCPDPGPTVCTADRDVALESLVDRARRHHRDGELEKAVATLDKAMAAYDWAGLYATLDRVARQVPNSSHIFVETQASLPVAIPLRIIALARHRRAAPEKDGCARSFSSDAALFAADPCTKEGRSVTMFDRPTWLAE